MPEPEQFLKWRVDVNTFRLLGRELITDRVTAIFELVKNCYDANASSVEIKVFNPSSDDADGLIVISDNGEGMTFADIQDKWMVVGTNSKRASTYSGAPYNRKLVGEKGVGRFAVEKLGSKLLLRSKQDSEEQTVCVEIDWRAYEAVSEGQNIPEKLDNILIESEAVENSIQSETNLIEVKKVAEKLYFTDIKNRYWYEESADFNRGTELHISGLREEWTENDIIRLTKELSRLISPLSTKAPDFTISLLAPDFDAYSNLQKIENKLFDHVAYKVDLYYDLEHNLQDVLKFNKQGLEIVKKPFFSMGPVRMVLYYFDSAAKRKFKAAYVGEAPDGIKVYRDGLIATPFAETTADENKKKDILGIDKRKYNAFFEKLGNRDLLGVVEITKALNPLIIDSTSRQDFVENKEYAELKQFIIDQIVEIEKSIKYKRDIEREETDSKLKGAKGELDNFTETVKQIIAESPGLGSKLTPLLTVSKRVQSELTKGINAYNQLQKDKEAQASIFMSLMSLQDYAAQMAHIVRIGIERVLHLGEFFKKYYPNPKFEDSFKRYANEIYDEMLSLNKAVEYMLSYALAETETVEVDITVLLRDLFEVKYAESFKKEGIHHILDVPQEVVKNANPRFLLDIFENLINNSIKALDGQEQKTIKCSGEKDENGITILFSDNGPGIPLENHDRIFNIYFTTTAEKGGGGIGLFVVQSRVDAMKGTIEIVEPEFSPRGTSFRIFLPFNK